MRGRGVSEGVFVEMGRGIWGKGERDGGSTVIGTFLSDSIESWWFGFEGTRCGQGIRVVQMWLLKCGVGRVEGESWQGVNVIDVKIERGTLW